MQSIRSPESFDFRPGRSVHPDDFASQSDELLVQLETGELP
jgi:hypothetical protein